MNKDYREILNSDAFKCIDERKKELILNLAERIKGKTAMESLDIFMENISEFTQGNSLTDSERAAIMMVLKSSMNENERRQFERMISMFNNIKK